MNEISNKILLDQFNSLPVTIKEAISRVSWKDKIKEIARRTNLNDEKASVLETETALVLFGLLQSVDYTQNIQREMGLDQSTAETISDLVYNEIILEIQKQFEMMETISQKEIHKTEEIKPIQSSEPKTGTSPELKTTSLEIPPNILPMIEPKEVVHDSKPTISQPIQKPSIPIPPKTSIVHYPNGKDPYREPIE